MSTPADTSGLRSYVEAFRTADPEAHRRAIADFYAPDAAINVVHPFNEVAGAEGYTNAVLGALTAAFADLRRTDYIAFSGSFDGGDWTTTTGYWCGHFHVPFLGIRPTDTLAHLRFGEFHRIEDGRAVQAYIFLDIPELMIAAGQWPIPDGPGAHRGYTGLIPGPLAQDGLRWDAADPDRSKLSLRMVTEMLRRLNTPDAAWKPYWSRDMLWYGPGAFGSFAGVEEFEGFQTTFEGAFSEWVGGAAPGSRTRHFTRFAHGDYVCSGGWPSLNCVQKAPFLGQPPTGERLYMRVCDWWRREGDRLSENWVFVDIPDVLLQLGRDVLGELKEAA